MYRLFRRRAVLREILGEMNLTHCTEVVDFFRGKSGERTIRCGSLATLLIVLLLAVQRVELACKEMGRLARLTNNLCSF